MTEEHHIAATSEVEQMGMSATPHDPRATSRGRSTRAEQRPRPGRRRPALGRMTARVMVVALLVTVFVPASQVESWSTPLTLSEEITDLVALDAQAQGLREDVSWSEPREAPLTFSAIGVAAPDVTSELLVRTSTDGVSWTSWDVLDFLDASDGPDQGSVEDNTAAGIVHTDALWVDEATHLQIAAEGASVADLTVTVIDSMGLSGGPVQHHIEVEGESAEAVDLDVISRAQWGADESLGSTHRTTADDVNMGIVHHTAHASPDRANSYSREDAPGLVRAMHRYHTRTLGWSDIGYNVLIDRFGNVYEGRRGGFANGIVGAHAAGYNTGSFGVSVIGNFTETQAPPAAIEALTEVIGVKSAIHGIDPTGWTDQVGDGAWRPTIIGHTDVGRTTCPGLIQDLLPQIREDSREMAVRFPDVPSTSPHRKAILSLAATGVTTGCRDNAFCPELVLNRGQASSFVARAFAFPQTFGSRFSDVPDTNAHVGAINALTDRTLLQGYGDGTFGPGDPMTRGQLATLLANTLDLSTRTLYYGTDTTYPDVGVWHTHAPAITALAEIGVRGDCGYGRFCPDDLVQRDSTASFVHMVLEVQRKEREAEARAVAEAEAEEELPADPGADGTEDPASSTEDTSIDDGTSEDPASSTEDTSIDDGTSGDTATSTDGTVTDGGDTPTLDS